MIASTCRIRTARPDDLDALMVLEQGFDADRISRRSMRRLLQRPSALIRVIDADTDHPTLVATLILLTRSNSRAARIYSLIVDTTQRGHGLAAGLVDDACHLAALAGCDRICLEVAAGNVAALALYQKLAFQPQRELPGYYDGRDGLRLCRGL